MMQKINLLFCIDKNYVDKLIDVLMSIRFHNECYFNVYLMSNNLTKEDIDNIENFISNDNKGQLHPILINDNNFKFPMHIDYISYVTYFRLFSPFIIKDDIDRLLYLDCDLICTGDILELYNMDFQGNTIIACENCLTDRLKHLQAKFNSRFGLPVDNKYINAGMLMIDVKKYREQTSEEELLNFINKNSDILYFQDQDVINVIFYNKIKHVDLRYNYQINAIDFGMERYDCSIVHYSEKNKPWNFDYEFVNKAIPYYNFLKQKGDFETLEKLIKIHTDNYKDYLLRHYCEWKIW